MHVEFFELAGVTLDSGERELLAQFLGVMVVRLVSIDRWARNASSRRSSVSCISFAVLSAFAHGRFARLSDLQHGFLEQTHITWRWLELGEYVSAESFELG